MRGRAKRLSRLLQVQSQLKQLKKLQLADRTNAANKIEAELEDIEKACDEGGLASSLFPDLRTQYLVRLHDRLNTCRGEIGTAMDQMRVEAKRFERIESIINHTDAKARRATSEIEALEGVAGRRKKPFAK